MLYTRTGEPVRYPSLMVGGRFRESHAGAPAVCVKGWKKGWLMSMYRGCEGTVTDGKNRGGQGLLQGLDREVLKV